MATIPTTAIWRRWIAGSAFALTVATPALSAETVATQKVELSVETLATGLDQPWSVELMPDGGYLVSERPGALKVIRDGKVGLPIRGMPAIFDGGQGGLLDVALDPGFAENRKIYFTASISGSGGQGTALFSAILPTDERAIEDLRTLFSMSRFSDTDYHFGSRIAVAPDGSLFFGVGERGEMDRAQDAGDHAGSILHIATDGSVPADNPFADGVNGLPEIWSVGHRNPQGIVIDPADGRLYTVEHGARGGDEINMPEPGKNYGWPIVSYGKHYSGADIGIGQAAEGYEQPLYYWDPSIAPGAIEVYRGTMFPEWQGNFLVAALKYQLLARLERDESGTVIHEERLFEGSYGRLRDVKVANDGAVLLLTDGPDAKLLRISRAPAS